MGRSPFSLHIVKNDWNYNKMTETVMKWLKLWQNDWNCDKMIETTTKTWEFYEHEYHALEKSTSLMFARYSR
jgi:hypothetical protein